MIFSVWAPHAKSVDLLLEERRIPLAPAARGYWQADVSAHAGHDYEYSLDGAAGAVSAANRVAAALNVPIDLDHGTVPVSASIGISVSDAPVDHDATPDSLLQHADTAMYYAKSLGGSHRPT